MAVILVKKEIRYNKSQISHFLSFTNMLCRNISVKENKWEILLLRQTWWL